MTGKFIYKCKACGKEFPLAEKMITTHSDGESEQYESFRCPDCNDEIIIPYICDCRGYQVMTQQEIDEFRPEKK